MCSYLQDLNIHYISLLLLHDLALNPETGVLVRIESNKREWIPVHMYSSIELAAAEATLRDSADKIE